MNLLSGTHEAFDNHLEELEYTTLSAAAIDSAIVIVYLNNSEFTTLQQYRTIDLLGLFNKELARVIPINPRQDLPFPMIWKELLMSLKS